MRNIVLVDTGPIVALFDRDDLHHDRVVRFLEEFEGKLVTSWPVMTEVSYMLNFNLRVQIDFLKWAERGGVEIWQIDQHELDKMIEDMERYLNVPMDLADASLLFLAKKHRIDSIVTIDRDYYIYRTNEKKMLRHLLDEEGE